MSYYSHSSEILMESTTELKVKNLESFSLLLKLERSDQRFERKFLNYHQVKVTHMSV